MAVELEAKFLRVDPDSVRDRLREVGAIRVYAERLMCRKTYDFPDRRLGAQNAWVRVRDEKDRVTMSYKRVAELSLQGMEEVMIQVDSFDHAGDFLKAIGLEQKSIQESRRETWEFQFCEITIDWWPWVPPFVEVEGPSEEAIRAVSEQLGFDWSKKCHGGIEVVYEDFYEVKGKEVTAWREMMFGEVPEELQRKRRG